MKLHLLTIHRLLETTVNDTVLNEMNLYASATLCQSVYNNTFTCFRCPDATLLYSLETQLGAGYITKKDNEITVAFRGSKSMIDYYHDFDFKKVASPWGIGLIHSGFLKIYNDLRLSFLDQVELTHAKKVKITGHSLGGVLAILFALDLQSRNITSTVYTFGQPRIGNTEFVESIDLQIHKVVADGDIVPTLPPTWFGYDDLKSINYIIRFGDTFLCEGQCKNQVSLNFKVHETGYYHNTTLIPC